MGNAFLLGAVEGVTEFLPVSSTAHLMIAAQALGIAASPYRTSFAIAVQFGAAAAIAVCEWQQLWRIRALAAKVLVAFLPTGFLGALLYPLLRSALDETRLLPWALLLGGVAMLLFERLSGRRADCQGDLAFLSYRQALMIGLWQVLAFVPGVSRSAATIIGGMLAGLPRRAVVEFSFLLAIPTLTLATGYDLFRNAASFSAVQAEKLLAGSAVAFAVAWVTARFLLRFITRHTFVPFALYRIFLAGALWLVAWF